MNNNWINLDCNEWTEFYSNWIGLVFFLCLISSSLDLPVFSQTKQNIFTAKVKEECILQDGALVPAYMVWRLFTFSIQSCAGFLSWLNTLNWMQNSKLVNIVLNINSFQLLLVQKVSACSALHVHVVALNHSFLLWLYLMSWKQNPLIKVNPQFYFTDEVKRNITHKCTLCCLWPTWLTQCFLLKQTGEYATDDEETGTTVAGGEKSIEVFDLPETDDILSPSELDATKLYQKFREVNSNTFARTVNFLLQNEYPRGKIIQLIGAHQQYSLSVLWITAKIYPHTQ